jgi:hypothetical protein
MEYSSGLGDEIEVDKSPPPPFQLPAEFELRPSEYSFRALADRFSLVSIPWTVDDEPSVELELSPAPEPQAAAVPPVPPPEEVSWRGLGLDDEGVPSGSGGGDDMAMAYEVAPSPTYYGPLEAWEPEAAAAPAPAPPPAPAATAGTPTCGSSSSTRRSTR